MRIKRNVNYLTDEITLSGVYDDIEWTTLERIIHDEFTFLPWQLIDNIVFRMNEYVDSTS